VSLQGKGQGLEDGAELMAEQVEGPLLSRKCRNADGEDGLAGRAVFDCRLECASCGQERRKGGLPVRHATSGTT
jgi:hypothetical protein